MKLGTLKEGGRDGTLVVVSRDLSRAVKATAVAPTLQAVLDDWAATEAPLQGLYDDLNAGRTAGAFDFDPAACASPLPRAYQFVDGSAYLNHVALVRKARGASMPPEFLDDPLMYQAESDAFYGPRDDIPMASESYGIDFESEVAVIVDDTPMGASPERCAGRIRLAMILNDVSLRGLIPAELAKGFGFLNGKGSTAFSPVAVTLDELGAAWRDGKVHLPLVTHWNGREFGRPNAGVDMNFSLPRLISHAAKTRRLGAGTIVGSGTVSNVDPKDGYSCIAEIRAIETVEHGAPKTPFMAFGDTVRVEMFDDAGASIFGAIEQQVVRYSAPA
ncbi:MAG: fumarylacetoacetate hydrolase family protein [Rhodospirillaceae bacterium]|nr:fumarylacetoacetate hydrolase family protein [Rhodospirillaceae bacterium]